MDRDYSKYEPLFGSWTITKKLGTGAAGSVFEIERTDEFGVTFHSALKAITIPAGGEEEIKSVLFSGVSEEDLAGYYEKIVETTAEEFRCMARLKGNGHIVSYEDHQIIAHEDDPGYDILMRVELLTPLLDYHHNSPMTESEILKMGTDLCKGLEVCAQNGIIHRDIKPANIFVSPTGDYKLGDFGIAKIVESTQISLSRKGTYTYMAPEVYRGQPYNETSDIYSLGMVLYQCLNDGRSLFMPAAPMVISHDDTEEAFAKRIVRHDIPLPAHGSAQLKRIVQKACAYDPADRYQSAAEMRQALEAVRYGREFGTAALADGTKPIAAEHAPTDATEPETVANRRPFLRWVIAAILLLLIAGGAIAYAVIPHEIESIEGIDAQTEIYIGNTLQPEYQILPERFAEEPIAFSSSNEEVFRVNEGGAITAVSVGSAVLTMSADEYSRSVEVTVVPKVTSIENVGESIRLETGEKKTLSPKLQPKEFSDEPVIWTMKDPSVAKVSDEGKVTALAAGSTTLQIEAGGCSREVAVTVKDPPPPEPVYQPASSGSSSSSSSGKKSSSSKKTSKSSSKKKSSGSKKSDSGKSKSGDKGYFKDSDKEYF